MGVRISVRLLWTKSQDDTLEYEFAQERIIIGRSGSADVQLPHAAVSSSHATIQAQGSGYELVDEGSTNGTRINGERIPAGRAKPLRSGDEIEIGGFELLLTIGVPVATATSAERTSALARQMVRELLKGSQSEVDQPRLTVLNGPAKGTTLSVPPPPSTLVLGRAQTCDLVIPDVDASREHVELVRNLTGTIAKDLDSKNGLMINSRLASEKRLEDRDELKIGETLIVFEDPAADQVSRLEGGPDKKVDLLPLAEEAVEPEPVHVAASDAKPSRNPWQHAFTAEMLIFALAGLVVLASAAAMFWLLTSE